MPGGKRSVAPYENNVVAGVEPLDASCLGDVTSGKDAPSNASVIVPAAEIQPCKHLQHADYTG
jgi:hypothetical protein